MAAEALPRSGPTTDDLKSRDEFAGGTYSYQSEIDGRIVPAAAACPTICTICCQLYHSDYCAAASVRNLLHLYVTLVSTSLILSQPYIFNHLSLGHYRGALSVGRRDQTK